MSSFKNDKGNIFVITMAFSLFLSALLLYYIEMYNIEKRFSHEVDEVYKLQNLVTVCLDELLFEFVEQGERPSTMQKNLPHGNVAITVNEKETVISIELSARSNSGRRYEVTVELDIENQRIISWAEL